MARNTQRRRRQRPVGKDGQRRQRRPRWLVIIVVAVLVLAAGVAAASQFVSVKDVKVNGTVSQDPGAVRDASGIGSGDRMAGVDTGEAAASVSNLPWVDTVTVSKDWPSTVTISVTEYTAVGVIDDGGTPVVVDPAGRQFLRDTEPEGAVKIVAQASDQEAVTAAAESLAALPEEIRGRVTEVDAPAADSVTLKIDEDREIFWGTSDRADEKAEATRVVLTREEPRWNVSNPAQPAVRN